MYRLSFDPRLTDQWFIDTPVDQSRDEWAFWRLLSGSPLEATDHLPWRSKVKQAGQRLSFSFAGFDVPVVTEEVASALGSILGDQSQFPQLHIVGENSPYRILVATRTVRCVDEPNSQFTKWSLADGRPDKCGEYRMVTRLRLDPALVPADAKIFRVWGWKQALVVTETVAGVLRSYVHAGLVYEPVV
ncbi:hypothetical protein [Methylibium rhizosphaerae]|uniref:hypothetical protein n=1 Tax=Methylibium rhizosphaerae TaxID=2570323 RepID=UPI00112814C3|nr:hypothetical protein [Methylibium rhizosphaerae]